MDRLYSIVDLGSNSVRLAVYEVKKTKRSKPIDGITEIVGLKKMAGLSGYVVDSEMSKAGIEKASDILQDFKHCSELLGCKEFNVFATAAIRNANNSKKIARELEQALGVHIDIISGDDEAYLDFIGASSDRKLDEGTLVDIGGGSTEFVALHDGKPSSPISLPQGSISSYSQFVDKVLPTKWEYGMIAKAFREQMRQCASEADYASPRIYGVGGSMRALAKMVGACGGQVKARKRVSLKDLQMLEELLFRDVGSFAHIAVKATPERVHSVACALSMTKVILSETGAEEIEVCKYGVREGYLLNRVLKLV